MADLSQIELPNGTTYDIDAVTVNGHTVLSDVPASADFLDTKVTQVLDETIDTDVSLLLAGTGSFVTNTGTTNKSYYAKYCPNSRSTTFGTRATNSSHGYNSFAIGSSINASGQCSFAQGNGSQASGYDSFATGIRATAEGDHSFAQGMGTVASYAGNHVFGEYNILDPSDPSEGIPDPSFRGEYIEIVGNGTTDSNRSNARTLDWDGNEVLSGKLTVGAAPTNNMDVTTKQYVDTGLGSKQDTLTAGTGINIDANNVISATGGGTITDVQVDGTSVVTSGVAEIDLTPYVAKSGDTMTGQLDIRGTAASKPLMTRGIVGSDGSGSDGALYLQYGNSTNDSIFFGNSGAGEIKSNGTLYTGCSAGLEILRTNSSCNYSPGINKGAVKEFNGSDLPSSHFYHVYTTMGDDNRYACQLALGMTTTGAYYRRCDNNTWGNWQSLINTNTTYTIATGDNNGQIKVTPSSGSAYNVSVKGLGSAAYLTANTAASNSTVVQRNSSGYVYANYFNTTCSAVNPSSYTNSRGLFTSDDGFIRKCTAANFRSMIGLGSFAPGVGNKEGSTSIANGGEDKYTTMQTLSIDSGRMYIIYWNVEFQGGNNAGWGAGRITTSGDTLYGGNRSFKCKLNSDNYHTVNGVCFIKTTAARTITLQACQTSGAARTAYGKVCALAIPTSIVYI